MVFVCAGTLKPGLSLDKQVTDLTVVYTITQRETTINTFTHSLKYIMINK